VLCFFFFTTFNQRRVSSQFRFVLLLLAAEEEHDCGADHGNQKWIRPFNGIYNSQNGEVK
jgi:hypothetical protein